MNSSPFFMKPTNDFQENPMTTPSSSHELFANLVATAAPQSQSQEPAVNPPPPADVDNDEGITISELDLLKQRARLMGLTFSNNIGLDALKAKVKAKLSGEIEKADKAEPTETEQTATTFEAPAPAEKKPSYMSKRQRMVAEKLKLVRVRITNMNPNKKDLHGEIFTVANRTLGTIKKFVPYGDATENGYHIPYVIYRHLKTREFLQIKNLKDSKGRKYQETKWVREFAIEVLPQLTQVELARLAASQAAKGGLED